MTNEQLFLKNLGSAVKAHRVKLNLSQEQLAEKADLHRTYIGMVERAERNITIYNLVRIANALEITVQELIDF